MPLDIDHVRSQFPALASDWGYFDNAGGSQVLRTVAERVADYMLTTSVQTGASYQPSVMASARVAEARARIATYVGASRPDEIVFTNFDHESNIGPWLELKQRGVVFKVWEIDPDTLTPSLDDLGRLMGPRTKLVCVTHASNLLGSINPIRACADFVHERGALICVDGVAYAPHRAIDVEALGVDYYVFSFYKTYGPHYAVMYGRHELLLELDGLYHYFYGRDKVPGKLEPGNPCYELAWGSAGIVDYIEGLAGGFGRAAIEQAFEDIAAHEAELGERLLSWLRQRNGVRIVGHRGSDAAIRVPTISFTVEGQAPQDIVARIDDARIGVRHGDFHSRRLAEALGLAPAGVIRASMVHYNTISEVDRLISALDVALR